MLLLFLFFFINFANLKLLIQKPIQSIGSIYYQDGIWNQINLAHIMQQYKNKEIYLTFFLWNQQKENKQIIEFTVSFNLDQRTNIIGKLGTLAYISYDQQKATCPCLLSYEIKNLNEKNQMIPFNYIAKKKKILASIQSSSSIKGCGIVNQNFTIEAQHNRESLGDYYFILAHALITTITFFFFQFGNYQGIKEIDYFFVFIYESAEAFTLGIIYALKEQIPNPSLQVYVVGLIIIAVIKVIYIISKQRNNLYHYIGNDQDNNCCMHWVLFLPFLFGYGIFTYSHYHTFWFFIYIYFVVFGTDWPQDDNYIIGTFLIILQQTFPLIVLKLFRQNFIPFPTDLQFALIFMLFLFFPILAKSFKLIKFDRVRQNLQTEPLINQLKEGELALFECGICLENGRLKPQKLNELKDEDGLKLLCCGNPIHKKCIKSWINSGKSTCVFCRRDLGRVKHI